MRLLRAAGGCAAITLAVVVFVYVVLPVPGSQAAEGKPVLLPDLVALIAGLLAMMALSARIMGTRWAALVVGLMAPAYLVVVVVGGVLVPYSLAWVRCGQEPVILSEFSASSSYRVPGSRFYGPNLFDSGYVCTAQEAEARGYHRFE